MTDFLAENNKQIKIGISKERQIKYQGLYLIVTWNIEPVNSNHVLQYSNNNLINYNNHIDN